VADAVLLGEGGLRGTESQVSENGLHHGRLGDNC